MSTTPPRTGAERWAKPAFAAAAAAGLIVALFSAVRVDGPTAARGDAIAMVDGVAVPRERFAQAVAALEADKRTPLTDSDRARALSRLIDEELLVGRALALDVPQTEPAVRKALVDVMVRFAILEVADAAPSEAELQRFYAERPEFARPAVRLRARAVALPADAAATIEALRARLRAGEPLLEAAAALGLAPLPTPEGLAPIATLTAYLGPSVTAAASRLAPGETAGPIAAGGLVYFVQTTLREEAERPPWTEARAAVEAEWRRRAQERALDAYLAALRAEADIRFAPDAPQ